MMDTITQNERLLDYLKENGSITLMEAFNFLGIYRLSARIYDLRAEGHIIDTERNTIKNRYGHTTTVATYILRGEHES